MMHTLTQSEAETARRALAVVLPQADALGLLFYARLFELDPSLRDLFKVDLQDQAHTLMTMIKLSVEGLDERVELSYALRNLGARHVGYGVKLGDYDTVHTALLWTLEQSVGDQWNAETAGALNALLLMFIEEMQRGIPEREKE